MVIEVRIVVTIGENRVVTGSPQMAGEMLPRWGSNLLYGGGHVVVFTLGKVTEVYIWLVHLYVCILKSKNKTQHTYRYKTN